MPKFTIPVWWSLACDMEVEADNLQEAIRKVERQEIPWPDDSQGEYIDGSFTVNVECAETLENLEPYG